MSFALYPFQIVMLQAFALAFLEEIYAKQRKLQRREAYKRC